MALGALMVIAACSSKGSGGGGGAGRIRINTKSSQAIVSRVVSPSTPCVTQGTVFTPSERAISHSAAWNTWTQAGTDTLTEREFQNVAKLRLDMLFAGSTEGAHRACVLLGIVATCRAQGVHAQAYLTWAFDRLGTHRDLFALPLEEMTPAAFKKSLA